MSCHGLLVMCHSTLHGYLRNWAAKQQITIWLGFRNGISAWITRGLGSVTKSIHLKFIESRSRNCWHCSILRVSTWMTSTGSPVKRIKRDTRTDSSLSLFTWELKYLRDTSSALLADRVSNEPLEREKTKVGSNNSRFYSCLLWKSTSMCLPDNLLQSFTWKF